MPTSGTHPTGPEGGPRPSVGSVGTSARAAHDPRLEVQVRAEHDLDVVVLVGELDTATAPTLRSTIDRLLITGRTHIVVDLDGVTFLDAAALDVLITATAAAALAGGRLQVSQHPRFLLLLDFTCETHRVDVLGAVRRHDAVSPSGTRAAADADLSPLLRRSTEGDRSAFAAVYDATATRAYGLALRMLGDPEAAAQVVQEAYLHVWRHSTCCRPYSGSVTSWVLVSVHRCAVNRLRSPRRPARAEVSGSDEPTDDTWLAIGPQRQAVELAYLDGRTHAEIDRLMGLPSGTALPWIREGLRTVLGWTGRR